MSSEIRTNLISSRAGLSTVTMTDSGPMFSGITTFVDNSGFTFGVGGGTSIFTPATNVLTFGTNNTEKIRIDASGHMHGVGVITATHFYGDGSNLTGISAGFSQDAQGNLLAGTNAGSSLDGSSAEYNILLGQGAGESTTDDDYNIMIGLDAGKNSIATQNIFIGWEAAKASNDASNSQNIVIGHQACYTKTTLYGSSTVVGVQAGLGNGSMIANTFFGYRSGGNSYNQCTFVGSSAGRSATSACDFTTGVGANALRNNEGTGNVAIGADCGQVLTSGEFNTLAGYKAGRGGLSGTINYTDCVAIGSSAAVDLSSANNVIVIGANANPSSNTVTNEITLGNANITKFRIPGLDYVNDAGKVGIGLTNPSSKLEVRDGAAQGIIVRSTSTQATDSNKALRVRNNSDTDVLSVSHKGLLEIAKGELGTYLKVGGDDASNGRALTFTSSNSSSNGALHTLNATSGNGVIAFATAGTERLRIHTGGKLETKNTFTSSAATFVHIGDDQGSFNFDMSDSSGGTDYIRHVKKRFVSKGSTGLTITSRSTLTGSYTKAGESSIKFSYPSAGGGNQAGGQLEFWTNQNGYAGTTEAKRMQIDNGGNIGAPTGNNIYNASDERLKENMVELTNGLDKIKKLKPISFNWKDGWVESLSGKKEYGFGAQTTQVVDEMLVEPFGTDDALLNGETIKNPLRVNEKYITPLLVKAIQEQQEQIEILKQENMALRVRVTNLEDK